MHIETTTPTPAADLRSTPTTTYGPAPQEEPKSRVGTNQYGDRFAQPYRHQKTLEAFIRYVRLDRSPQTARVYLAKLRPLLRFWDALPPEEWTNLAFEEYLSLAKAGQVPGQPKPISVRTQQLLIQSAKLFGEWCINHGISLPWVPDHKEQHLRRYFWEAVKKPKGHLKELTGLLTLEQAKRLAEAAYGRRIELGIALAVGTGARKGEVERALFEDYRDSDQTLLLRREKTHLHHRVPVPPFLQEIIKRHRNRGTGLMVGKMPNLTRQLQRLALAAQVPMKNFHGLRHTWASESIARGTPTSTVMRLGGWGNLKTLSRYSHAVGDSEREAAARLG